MRDTLADDLRTNGYIPMFAEDFSTVVQLLHHETFDFIIADISSPELEMLRLMHVISQTPYDPGVCLVNSGDTFAVHAAQELALSYSVNVLGVFQVPFDSVDLLVKLNEVSVTRQRGGTVPETVLSETEFLRGLMAEGLEVVFQPKKDMKTGSIYGAEAFARWKSLGGGLFGAGAVVKVAREQGHMDAFTYRMLELVAAQLKIWSAVGIKLELSVNISSENLRDEEFADVVSGIVEQYTIEPHMLRLEVTESDLEDDIRVPLLVLSQLHARGFGLAIDDFGTGFASLLKLTSIPFDEIVIDRTFINRAAEDKVAHAILESSIELAHKLDLRCVCEGIENDAQEKLVGMLGTDAIQGYGLGKPMSASEFEDWLKARNS